MKCHLDCKLIKGSLWGWTRKGNGNQKRIKLCKFQHSAISALCIMGTLWHPNRFKGHRIRKSGKMEVRKGSNYRSDTVPSTWIICDLIISIVTWGKSLRKKGKEIHEQVKLCHRYYITSQAIKASWSSLVVDDILVLSIMSTVETETATSL